MRADVKMLQILTFPIFLSEFEQSWKKICIFANRLEW